MTERNGGAAAIVCDTTGNTVRQGSCDRCLAIGSESVSTGVWCVPGFGAGFEIALEPSELQEEGENPGKGPFIFCAPNPGMHQTLVQKRSDRGDFGGVIEHLRCA